MEQGAKLLLLLLLGILAVNLAKGGPNQVKTWLQAKFLGKA
jgi:hypothetical protein